MADLGSAQMVNENPLFYRKECFKFQYLFACCFCLSLCPFLRLMGVSQTLQKNVFYQELFCPSTTLQSFTTHRSTCTCIICLEVSITITFRQVWLQTQFTSTALNLNWMKWTWYFTFHSHMFVYPAAAESSNRKISLAFLSSCFPGLFNDTHVWKCGKG